MVAFAPLGFITGRVGAFLGVLPVVVVCALGMSLIEAFLVLPAHLGHEEKKGHKPDAMLVLSRAVAQRASVNSPR